MDEKQKSLPLGRNLKIGLFHLGSGMADVLTTGVWNRVMISDLGFAATPVGLLVSLRYFLAPLGIWAGRMSDQRSILGFRRLFWIWLGRALMVLSTFVLGATTAEIATRGLNGSGPAEIWLLLAGALLTFSLGNALSGTTFLALIYDRAPEHQRGRAVGIVWTFLLLGFTVGGIFFSLLLPEAPEGTSGLSFTPQALMTLFIVAGVAFAALWLLSLIGEERRGVRPDLADTPPEDRPGVLADLSRVWQNRHMRFFLFYLTLSMFFAFSQDLVLEPFAGDVFGMEARVTNRFSAYWGSTAIIGTLFFLWLSRKVPRLTNSVMSQIGVGVLMLTFALLTVSSVFEVRGIVTPGLILLGIGLGLWNVGTLGLMMDLSPASRAGTFLGFWSLSVTLARGAGVSGGGIIRDLWLGITGDPTLAYGVVFAAGTVGLIVAAAALTRVNVPEFKQQQADENALSEDEKAATVFAGAMD